MVGIVSRITQDEASQVRTIIGMLSTSREVHIGHVGDLPDVVVQILAERSRAIKAHTVSRAPSAQVKLAIRSDGNHLKWTYVERDPTEFGFRVDALFIDSLVVSDVLRVLAVWVPYMQTSAPVWIHDAEGAIESYPHIRKVGRIGRAWVCLVSQ